MSITILTIVITIYLIVIAYLGYLGYSHTRTKEDYLLAGRSTRSYVMALSYGATFISTSAIIGFGGVAGIFGMGLMWLTFMNILIGVFIAFVFFGKRTLRMGRKLAACTFPEFLGNRYQSTLIQKAGGLIIFLSMPLYTAVVLIGGARFIEQTLNVQFEIAVIAFSAIVAIYVVAGGLKGVMYTDALQGTIMFVGMVFLAAATYTKLGGVYAAHTALTNMAHLVPENLQAIGHQGWTALPATGSVWWWTLFSTIVLGVGIGVLAQPQLIVRFMTVRSDKELNQAVLVGGIFILATVGATYVVGALSNVFFYRESGDIAIETAQGNHDLIIPLFVNKAMPSWFVYVFMLSLLSAAMSTISSQFHAMGTSIGRDFFENVRKTRFDTVVITRFGIVVAIIVSVTIGYRLPGGVIAQGTAIFFSVCAATFLPAYLSGLYWKRATKAGALASILTGAISSLFCLLFLHAKEAEALGICKLIFGRAPLVTTHPWSVVDPILIALPLSMAAMIVISLFTERLPDEHVEKCFAQWPGNPPR